MGTDGMSKRKDIHTILSLGLKTEGATEQVCEMHAGVGTRAWDDVAVPRLLRWCCSRADACIRFGVPVLLQTKAPICVELSPDNLQSLYETLEKIQGQLDVLSDKPV